MTKVRPSVQAAVRDVLREPGGERLFPSEVAERALERWLGDHLVHASEQVEIPMGLHEPRPNPSEETMRTLSRDVVSAMEAAGAVEKEDLGYSQMVAAQRFRLSVWAVKDPAEALKAR